MNRNRPKRLEKVFFAALAIASAVAAAICTMFPSASFGVLFGALLSAACLLQLLALCVSETTGSKARWAVLVAQVGRILFLAFVLLFAATQIFIFANSSADEEAYEADYLIVLGAGLNGAQPSPALASRLRVAKDALERNGKAKAIVCGGQGANEIVTEAYAMKAWLVRNGVDEARIVMEECSTNTAENIRFAKDILDALEEGGDYQTTVVTNEFHLGRAKRLMARHGLDPVGLPAQTPVPAFRVLMHIRESASLLAYVLFHR